MPTPTPGPTPTPTPTVPPSPDSPVAYWQMEEGAGTRVIDASGHGYELNLASYPARPAWSPDAPPSPGGNIFSLHFDGTDDFAYGADLLEVDGGSELTVEAWVKFDELQALRTLVGGFQHSFATQWLLMTDMTGYELLVVISAEPSVNLCCHDAH